MSAALLFRTGSRAGNQVTVEGDLVLGRGDVDLVLDDPEASRRHAAIVRTDSGYELEDLGSKNGTTVDGKPVVGRVALPDGARHPSRGHGARLSRLSS